MRVQFHFQCSVLNNNWNQIYCCILLHFCTWVWLIECLSLQFCAFGSPGLHDDAVAVAAAAAAAFN